jgi:3-oxoadipate CoA-transferase alpha subunit
MIDKRVATLAEALAGVKDGAVVLIAGFGNSGIPVELIDALIEQGAKDLTVVSNNAGSGRTDVAKLLGTGRVRKLVCSYPRTSGSVVFEEMYSAGKLELELVPQGTLSERLRAAAAGIGGFYTPTAAGTKLAEGKETRTLDGRDYVFERPLKGDVALVKAELADRWGNLTYRLAARNFGPTMAAAAALTVVQARRIVDLGEISPEHVVTPGIFVDRVVEVSNPKHAGTP